MMVDVEERLSQRDVRMLQLIADGHTDKEIGEMLFLAHGTVKSRVMVIRELLGAKTRSHAVAIAYQQGFLVFPGAGQLAFNDHTHNVELGR